MRTDILVKERKKFIDKKFPSDNTIIIQIYTLNNNIHEQQQCYIMMN